jgi:hypothetical protein
MNSYIEVTLKILLSKQNFWIYSIPLSINASQLRQIHFVKLSGGRYNSFYDEPAIQ